MNQTPSTFQAIKHMYAGVPTSAANSASVDCQQYDSGHLTVLLSTTANAATSITAAKLQESSDNSTWADITGAAFTAVTTANDGATQMASVRLNGRARYIRAVVTGGGSNASDVNVLGLLQGASETKRNADAYEFEL